MAKSYRKYLSGAAAVAVVASVVPTAGFAATKEFTDANEIPAYAVDAVNYLVGKGALAGNPDGSFKPNASITRGEVATILANTLKLTVNESAQASFNDTKGHWASKFIAAVQAQKPGVLNGDGDGTFRPNDPISREEVASVLVRAYDLKLNKEADIKFSDVTGWSTESVNILASLGVAAGKGEGKFAPKANVTRAETAAFFHRAEVPEVRGHVGVNPIPSNILTITSDSESNSLVNGSKKVYKVKLVNPVSGKPVEGAVLNVTFKENINTNFGAQRKVTVTDAIGGSIIPYQSNDGEEAVAQIKTDKNGIATFTLTGTNAEATPIVFLDGSFQEWDTKGGILPKTQDGRFDPLTELSKEAAKVAFGGQKYTIKVDGQGGNYAAVTEVQRTEDVVQPAPVTPGSNEYVNGREYVINVKDADGKAYAGGVVNVGIDELLDGKLGNEPVGAYIADHKDSVNPYKLENKKLKDGRTVQATIKLDANGQAKFILASTKANDSAKPIVWIDQNFDNNSVNQVLEAGEPVSDSSTKSTNFQPAYVNGAKLKEVDLTKDARDVRFPQFKGLLNTEDVKGFQFFFLNQSGTEYLPPATAWDKVDAQVTYEIVNTGAHTVKVHTADVLSKLSLHDAVGADYISENGIRNSAIQIEVGGRVTIKGNVTGADWYKFNSTLIAAYAVGGNSSVRVSASAVVDGLAYDGYKGNPDGYNENQSVAVSAGPLNVDLAKSLQQGKDSQIIIEKKELKDIDGNGRNDQIVLTFDRPVTGAEAGDFRISPNNSDTAATKATLNSDGKKLTLEFSESVLASFANEDKSATVFYDRNFSGTLALTDLIGSKILSFNVTAK